MENIAEKCYDCGSEFVSDGIGTGYGYDKENHKVCYACCGKRDAKELETMKIGEKTCLYLHADTHKEHWGSEDVEVTDYSVVNWPSTLKIKVTCKQGWHNMARIRHDVWFTFGKNYFHGVQYGYDSEICYITCVKPR